MARARGGQMLTLLVAAAAILIASPQIEWYDPEFGEPVTDPGIAWLDAGASEVLRWIAEHATALGVDLERLIVVGTGSGAHAVLGALHSSDALRRTIQPTAAVAVWPMVDPLTSMRRSEETVERDALHAAAMAYFGSMERMRRAAVPERLHDGAPRQLPVLVVTRSDGVVGAPAEVSNELAHAWSNLGAPVQLIDCEPDDGTDLRTMLLELTVEGPRLDAEITPG